MTAPAATMFRVVFGESLKDAMKKGDGWKIPILIHKTTEYLKNKVTVIEGVFKAPASKWKVQKLREEFERGAVGLTKYSDPFPVGALLTMYLTSLPDPLITSPQQNALRDAFKTKSCDEFVPILRSILLKTPIPNKLLLKYLSLFLHTIRPNTDPSSLAESWAPVFFLAPPPPPPPPPPSPSGTPNQAPVPIVPPPTQAEIDITGLLIENYVSIWEERRANTIGPSASFSSISSFLGPDTLPKSASNVSMSLDGAGEHGEIRVKEKRVEKAEERKEEKLEEQVKSGHVEDGNGKDASKEDGKGVKDLKATKNDVKESKVRDGKDIKEAIKKAPPLSKKASTVSLPPPATKKPKPPPLRASTSSPALIKPSTPTKPVTPSKLTKPTPPKPTSVLKKKDAIKSPSKPPPKSPQPLLSTSTLPKPKLSATLKPPQAKSPKSPASSKSPKSPIPSKSPKSPLPSKSPKSPMPAKSKSPLPPPPPHPPPLPPPRTSLSPPPLPAKPHTHRSDGIPDLHHLADADLDFSDFRRNDDWSSCSSSMGSYESEEEEVVVKKKERREGMTDRVPFEDGVLFNNSLSGSLVPIPRLRLELIAPYEDPNAAQPPLPPNRKGKPASKPNSKNASPTKSGKSPGLKRVPSGLSKPISNKILKHSKSPSPVPRNRADHPHPSAPPHFPSQRSSSHSSTRSSHLHHAPTPPTPASPSSNPPSYQPSPSSSIPLPARPPTYPLPSQEDKRGESRGENRGEVGARVAAELAAKNRSLEAEVAVLKMKLKEDEEKLANEEKNVAFLLSRVEILDKQRVEAVNHIVDEKSEAEKELRVRISSLEAEVLVIKQQLKLTESAVEVKTLFLTNQALELEARVSLLQAQLDKAYEEIADKDSTITILEQEIRMKKIPDNMDVEVVVLQDNQETQTKVPNGVLMNGTHPISKIQHEAWMDSTPQILASSLRDTANRT